MTNPHDPEPVRVCCVCQRRQYERAQVCDPCRNRLGHTLTDISDLYAQVPDAIARGQAAGQRVTGSREAPIPVNLDAIDLTLPARIPGATLAAQAFPDDQIGQVAVAAVLDQWCRDWRDVRAKGEGLPLPTVPELIRWLRDRAEWACDRHPAIDDFAAEMGRLRAVLRGVLGLIEPPADFCDGIVCRACDRKALYRESDYVECDSCGLLYSAEEYREWTALLEADTQRRLKTGELVDPRKVAA